MEGLLKHDALAVCGLFVYLVFKIPTQSMTDTKPVRQVCLTSILPKENWLQLVGQAKQPVCWTLASSNWPGEQPLPLSFT